MHLISCSEPYPAKRRGTCALCNRRISVGEMIVTARNTCLVMHGHYDGCPADYNVHESPVIRIAGVR